MTKGRHVYTPRSIGWVVTRDMLRTVIDSIDCSAGGAQEAFDRKCAELQSQGWTLERRFADSRFANRGAERVEVGIERDPNTIDWPGYSV